MEIENRVQAAVEASAPWITSQRWYGDKARRMESVRAEFVTSVETDLGEAAFVVVRFSYDQGPDTRYFLPLLDGDIGGTEMPEPNFRDALHEPAFNRWLLKGFQEERDLGRDPEWRWRSLGAGPPATDDLGDDAIRLSSAEQSNSSVIVGDQLVLKVYRRLQPGMNPDLEIGEFLTRNGRYAHVPQLFGLVEVDLAGEGFAIAALQQFVKNNGDGWSWLIRELEAVSEESRHQLVEEVSRLGMRTAQLHIGLASDPDDEAFRPEAFDREDADNLIRRVVAEMEESVEGLAKRLDPADVEQLHKGIGQLMSGAWALVGSRKTRVHGDYHLGQTLRTIDDDFCLIDFEGEPSRPINQRREKQSPLKDVAGMLRSLDYAAATVGSASASEEKRQLIDAWLVDATAGFVASYRDAILEAGVPIVPDDDQRFNEALKLMTVEKALYEIRYELNNRPDWLSIPLDGIRRLAGIPV